MMYRCAACDRKEPHAVCFNPMAQEFARRNVSPNDRLYNQQRDEYGNVVFADKPLITLK